MEDTRYIPINRGGGMQTYLFNVSLEPDEDGWRAFYAPLEHLGASTWGATKDEAVRHISEVLSLILEELAEEGQDIPATEGLSVAQGTVVSITR
jgi:predicted RNase H-like HicB family nuclease